MSEIPDIRLLVENFRAIDHADIIINGITVVAGENGSGKSSISKLLYYLYKTVSNYENVVKRTLIQNLKDVITLFDIMSQEIRSFDGHEPRDNFRRDLRKSLLTSEFLEDEVQKWLDLSVSLEERYFSLLDTHTTRSFNIKRQDRVKYILQDILKIKNEDIRESFKKLNLVINKRFSEAQKTIDLRPTSIFTTELQEIFPEGPLPSKFEVQEYGDPIVALDRENLSIPYNIQNAIYIDSPMMFHSDVSDNIHWDDLTELLVKSSTEKHSVADLINKEIIQGDVNSEETAFSVQDFKFQRNDGETFNLLDVATGIKSFSILQLLLKNGSITDKTLMIIDEPESNLHPQWVIEYARIIVMLNKQLGVKFFLATHNPDMVSAIRYISEKEKSLEGVNFYLAEKTTNKFKYKYDLLGKEIDPIFASFNIALERINQYGV